MGYIIKEVNYKVPETFFWHHVLLSADMAKPADNRRPTIKAVFFLAFGCVAHNKFLLKINTSLVIKKYRRIKASILAL